MNFCWFVCVFNHCLAFICLTSCPPVPVSLSLICHFSNTQTGCGAEKDIRNVTSKSWMALTDTSAKRKCGLQKVNARIKIAVLISMAD